MPDCWGFVFMKDSEALSEDLDWGRQDVDTGRQWACETMLLYP